MLKINITLLATGLILTACGKDEQNDKASATKGDTSSESKDEDGGTSMSATAAAKDLVDTAKGAGTFGTLLTAVGAAELESTLRGAGPFTVFAPDDAAFAKIPKADLKALIADKKALKDVLLLHVVAGRFTAADLKGKTCVDTAGGQRISVAVASGKAGGSNIKKADIGAKNGVIHVVDAVITKADCTEDDEATPPADAEAAPPATTSPPTAPAAAAPATAGKDIVDTAVGAGTFKTLAKALTAADLVSTLKGGGPFTVFAPTDAAFAKIPAAALQALLADKAALKKVLLRHVVAGRYEAAHLISVSSLKTADGQTIDLTLSPSVAVNGSKVITADIAASNGIIHVVDTVIPE